MRKRIIALLAALLLFAPAAGAEPQCGGEALLEDFDYLCDALREAYPFLPVLERRGIDPEALFARTRERVAASPSPQAFYALAGQMFSDMDNLAHLGWVTPESLPYCAEYADARTRAAYAALAPAKLAAAATPPEIRWDWYPRQRALVFAIRSFDQALIERDGDALSRGLAEHPDAAHIVFDITGNRGGSDRYWSRVLVAPFGGSYSHEIVNWMKPTPLTRGYFDAADMRPLEDWPGDAPAFAEELGLTRFVAVTETVPPEPLDGPALQTDARRWVLIDGGVYSAADGFARFCADTGWATLVGRPTLGDGAKSGGPAVVRLPNTGLLFRFSAWTAANADGTLNAETGTRPDFTPKRRETALDACLRLIGAVGGTDRATADAYKGD